MRTETRVVFDVSELPRFQKGHEAPLWWGIVGLVVLEASVVASFIASYLYFRVTHAQWPPSGVPLPDLLWPSVSLVLLLASCVTMWGAGRALAKDRVPLFVILILSSLALASWVLVLRWQQFQSFEFRWDAHPYGSLVWTLTGFHFLHVVSAVIGTAVVAVLGFTGFFNSKRQLAVVVDSLYWYFVALVWVPLYLVLYWVPRWL